jgi:hypothetical protein
MVCCPDSSDARIGPPGGALSRKLTPSTRRRSPVLRRRAVWHRRRRAGQDIAEAALHELGGQQLRDAAHDAAGGHVDQHYPWDGIGDEPEQRVSAYIARVAAHYNVQRPYRALQLRAPRPELPVPEPVHRTVRRRPVLGGLICEYEPAARNSFSDATAEFWNSTPPPDAIRGPTTFVA